MGLKVKKIGIIVENKFTGIEWSIDLRRFSFYLYVWTYSDLLDSFVVADLGFI